MAAGRKSSTKAGAGKASSASSSGSSSSSSSGSSSSSSSSGSSKSSSSGSRTSSSSGSSRSASPTGSSRQTITQSNTQVVSTTSTKTPNAQPKPATSWFGTPTTSTTVAPYAQTQNRKFTTNSQSQIAKSVQSANTAQPQQFTYATTTSGNTFIIPSNLSLEARQYYAKLGIATSNQKPTTTLWSVDAGTDVIIDTELANADLEKDIQDPWGIKCPTKFGVDVHCNPIVTQQEDGFEQIQKPNVEQSEESNNVQLEANTYDSDGATTEKADYNYNLGSTLTQSDDSPLDVLNQQTTKEQWMQQQNQNIVPLETYAAFAANGKAGTNGVFTNGTGSASMQMGYENLKGSIGNIMQSSLFPIVVIGIIVLLVISFLRPKGAAAAPAAPSKVFQFA